MEQTATVDLTDERAAAARGDAPTRMSFAVAFAARLGLVYLFLSNWIWMDELIVNPTRPFRPVFDFVFGGLARGIGHRVFHLTGPLAANNFEDTQYLYLLLLTVALVSVLAAVVWATVDRSGRTIQPAYGFLRVWIRYTLAYMVMIYGMDKVFRLQFPFPSMKRLIEPLGDFSPMGVLWTYVGYSAVLTIFSGVAEVSGSVLLLFRRTAPLGALVTVVMMANVALMDFCYDVSVKMLSAHFLAMAIFLLAHDAERLLNVMAFNRTAPARRLEPVLPGWVGPGMRRALPWLKLLVVLYVVVPVTVRTYRTFRAVGPYAAKAPLYGLYRVDKFAVNGIVLPATEDDTARWRYVVIESPVEITVQTMDLAFKPYAVKYDAGQSKLTIGKGEGELAVKQGGLDAGSNAMTFEGKIGADAITAEMHRVDVQQFLLVHRGFHWINEKTFNK